MYVCLFTVLGVNGGPQILLMCAHLLRDIALREKQLSMKPPDAQKQQENSRHAMCNACTAQDYNQQNLHGV